ncbi:MAG TPA: I78 family peptidase inhibitor [Allosphingosinicella sp.]|jgi:hypothetical protein
MKAAAGAAAMAILAGCAAAPLAGAEEIPRRGAGQCDAAAAQGLVGQAAGEALGAEAMRLSRARVLRWVPIGAMVTMDYREDRLSIHLDADNKVVKIACG